MKLSLLLFLFGTTIFSIRAADPDVFPSEFLVPQCTVLEVAWGQPHLHVQPSNLINVTNLVDLGLQNGTSTTFPVTLEIGQNFTFAYNTIADQFTIFVSDLMQVSAGNASCLPGQSSAPSSGASQSSQSSSLTSTSASSSPSRGSSSSSSAKPFPVGAVAGSVGALAVVILLALGAFLCRWRVKSKKTMASLAVHNRNSSLGPESAFLPAAASSTGFYSDWETEVPHAHAQVTSAGLGPYLASQEHPKMRRFHLGAAGTSEASTPTTATLSTAPTTTAHAEEELEGDQPPAYMTNI
ncbi:hypothetical protein C8R45DRAFT_1027517 [Mycena sanguinolenta]|nr:hypothetical protein C8R45DRAFT_1027517 [Mycena sanguinolenta]